MKNHFLALMLILIPFLVSCEQRFFPDTLFGCIRNGIYSTQVGNKRAAKFSVAIPQSANAYETHYMGTQEIYRKKYTFVSFGPVVSDATIYRIMVVEKGNHMSLWDFKERYFKCLVNMAAKGYDRQMVQKSTKFTNVNGHPALFDVYTQETPSYYQYYGIHQTSDVMLTHAFYFIDYGYYAAILWIQMSSDSGVNGVNESNRFKIFNQTYKPINRFLKSFVISCYCKKCDEYC